ncbi:MAG: NUDIX domain-containing protein [Ardenticatenaceae bacterium]|nr:NUDIX domain-containing protein [Ardenticatenaceae bacterium]
MSLKIGQINTFCSYCGTRFENVKGYPRRCRQCQKLTFRNPVPVAVLLVPVHDENEKVNLLTVRRGIRPGKGELALPGGFLEVDETWQEGAVRELREETQVDLTSSSVTPFAIESAPDGTLLLFGVTRPIKREVLFTFKPSREVEALVLIDRPVPMAFSLHKQMVTRFFA